MPLKETEGRRTAMAQMRRVNGGSFSEYWMVR